MIEMAEGLNRARLKLYAPREATLGRDRVVP